MNSVNSSLISLVSLLNSVVAPGKESFITDRAPESPAVTALKGETDDTTLNAVLCYVRGETSFEDLSYQISPSTSYSWLAAAKIADLTTQGPNSTLPIREACLRQAVPEGKPPMHLFNALTTPPQDLGDSRIVNSWDITRVSDESLKEEMKRLAGRVSLNPEAAAKVRKVAELAFADIEKTGKALGGNQTIYLTGPSGSGKSTASKKLIQEKGGEIAPFGTDRFMDVYIPQVFKNDNDTRFSRFFMGLILRLELERAVKTNRPDIPFLQEGILQSPNEINELFRITNALSIVDHDADFKVLCLRVLAREKQRLSFENLKRYTLNSREKREQVIGLLREGKDSYELRYTRYEDCLSPDHQRSNELDKETVTQEKYFRISPEDCEQIGRELITETDVHKFGDAIRPFIGLSIKEALTKATAPR